MPVKYKKDEIVVKRDNNGTQTKSRKRHYMKNESTEFLINLLNEEKTKPKLKSKIRNFLYLARGVKLAKKAS
jgi:hypothetical protein|tara:strand:- start:1858 stop:2073 length:216 start_codon:yes stop_codon:yes gene_type:complete